MKEVGLYVHIPFCKKKCNYCDFNSYSNLDYLQEEYVDCLIREMNIYKEKYHNLLLKTIYVGGGTPTCLDERLLEKLINYCTGNFKIVDNCEISVEANPGTLTKNKLKILRKSGVNRLSIGLQSWHDRELKLLGRIHTKDQFIENYCAAREEGFYNINIDLIFGLPGQTLEKWEETLSNVISLEPEHISCYSLIIEEGTPFYRDYINNNLKLPEEDLEREMYHQTICKLSQHGYNHYEISNFAKKGFESKHNLIYWHCEEYIGIGAGAHSYIDNKRYSNISLPMEYVAHLNKFKDFSPGMGGCIEISEKDMISEYMFLNLRLIKGVNAIEFKKRFNMELQEVFGKQLDKFMKLNLLRKEDDNYYLTMEGINVSNRIFAEFLL